VLSEAFGKEGKKKRSDAGSMNDAGKDAMISQGRGGRSSQKKGKEKGKKVATPLVGTKLVTKNRGQTALRGKRGVSRS